jgi:hypothetical protein
LPILCTLDQTRSQGIPVDISSHLIKVIIRRLYASGYSGKRLGQAIPAAPRQPNPTGSTWNYRSLGEVQANVGQTFTEATGQASFWNGFFYSGSRNNPPTVPIPQSAYNGGPLESSYNAFWLAFEKFAGDKSNTFDGIELRVKIL